jgi:hypothetical protein
MGRLVGVVAALTLVASIMVTQPASASPTGKLVYVQTTTIAQKGGTATTLLSNCPSGSRLIGVGGSIKKSPFAWLTRIEPFDAGGFEIDTDADDGAHVDAWDGSAADLKMKSVAICLTGTDAGSLTYFSESQNAGTGTGSQGDEIGCGSDANMGGGGGVDPDGEDILTKSMPSLSGTVQYAINYIGASGTRAFTGTSICMPGGVVLSLKKFLIEDVKAGETKKIDRNCPAGYHVAAGGVDAGSSGRILASKPFDGPDDDSEPDDGWSVKVYEPTADKTVDLSIVCVG